METIPYPLHSTILQGKPDMKMITTFLALLIASSELQIALASDTPSEVYAQTTHSPPHFYVKLQRMTSSKAQCKQTAMIAMAKSAFTDIVSGKHGIWGVKDGYKAQIKCSQKEKVIVFIVVGSEGKMVMILNDQLQHNFGKGFSNTRDL